MRLFYIVLAVLIIVSLVVIGYQNNSVYDECIAEGVHSNDKCYQMAYM